MHARGITVLSRLAYLKTHYAAQLNAVLAQLSDQERQTITTALPVTKIPMPVYMRFNDAIAHVCAPNDPNEVFVAMGRASAEANLKEHQNGFMRIGDPQFVLSALPRLHKFYNDSGHVEYKKLSPTSAEIRMVDLDAVSSGDCLTNKGWFTAAIEMSGGHAVKVQHTRCRMREDDVCEFLCQWSA